MQTLTVGDLVFSRREIVIALVLAGDRNPDEYADPEVKAVIHKLKSLREES